MMSCTSSSSFEDYEDLGGKLPDDLQAYVDDIKARRQTRGISFTALPATKVLRNDPCPCGSGKNTSGATSARKRPDTTACHRILAVVTFVMADVQSVEDVAKMLAREHVSDDPNITEIYWARHPKEVRLVEVTSSVSDKGEVLPFRFTEDPPDVPFQSVVVLLSPGDWQRRKGLEWPDGFEDADMERVFSRAG